MTAGRIPHSNPVVTVVDTMASSRTCGKCRPARFITCTSFVCHSSLILTERNYPERPCGGEEDSGGGSGEEVSGGGVGAYRHSDDPVRYNLSMGRTFFILGWGLVVTAVLVVGISLVIPDVITNTVSGALVLSGMLVALAGHLFGQAKAATEADEQKSRFYLQSCIDAYKEAKRLLEDQNNHRATWIEAGRALANARALSDSVTVDAHRRVFEVTQLKYRGFFHNLLRNQSAAFYYGGPSSLSIDKAAEQSSAPEERHGHAHTSTVKELSEKSIYAVWQAAQWPEDYQDPSDRTFTEEEQGKLLVLFPGLYEYLQHSKQWGSAAGELFPRDPEKSR